MASIRSDESGFSLIELLTAMVLGMVVLGTLMTLMNTGFKKTAEVNDRAENAQIARAGMDRITTLLDSTVCIDAQTPPLIGSDSTVSPAVAGSTGSYAAFWADLNGATSTPDKFTLTYDATAKTITESRFDGGGSTAAYTRVILSNVVPDTNSSGVALPVFQYFAYQSNGQINPTPLTTPVTQLVAPSAVRVTVAFKVISRRTKVEDGRLSRIESQSAIGTPDPSQPTSGACPT